MIAKNYKVTRNKWKTYKTYMKEIIKSCLRTQRKPRIEKEAVFWMQKLNIKYYIMFVSNGLLIQIS